MKRMKQYMRRPSFLSAAVMAALLAVVGCGDFNESPMNSLEDVNVEEVKAAPAGYLVFSQSTARQVATKRGKKIKIGIEDGVYAHSTTKAFKFKKRGKLELAFKSYGENKNQVTVKNVAFSVKKNSIDVSELTEEQLAESVRKRAVDITMSVSSGEDLDDVVVAFGPSGLLFNPAAKLVIRLNGNLKGVISEGKSSAYHIDARGTVTKVTMNAVVGRNSSVLQVEVPGFSRYTWDD